MTKTKSTVVEKVKKVVAKKFQTLKLGSVGVEVKELQKLLAKNGSTIKVTGKFDIGTRSAVCAFQNRCIKSGKYKTIKSTGVVDAATWSALNKVK